MLLNLLTILVFLLMFSVLVAVHELGHYLFARLFKMGVSEFSIGMGTPIVRTWMRKKYQTTSGEEAETAFNIRPIPLGGFVKIHGMEPQEDGSEVSIPDGFYSRKPWQRIIVLLAGPTFSILLGLMILAPVIYVRGEAFPSNKVTQVTPAGAAAAAGLQKGDRILSVNNQPIKELFGLRKALSSSGIQPIEIQVERNGKPINFRVTPKLSNVPLDELDAEGNPTGKRSKMPVIGIALGLDYKPVSMTRAVVSAVEFPIMAVQRLIERINNPVKLVEDSTGVIGMVVLTREMVGESLLQVLMWSAVLSISVGIMNLLPIGPLDGGQTVIALVEWIRGGKRLPIGVQNAFFLAGIAVMLIFFVAVTGQDIVRFVLPK